MFVCGLFFCLMCLCVLFVIYCVAWSACVCVDACVCVCDVVRLCVVFGKLNVCCFVLYVIYVVRCSVVCDGLCVSV